VLQGAVSVLTAGLVRGPERRARVCGAGWAAVYLEVGGTVLPVVTSDALALPTAVRLGVGSTHPAWRPGVATPAEVGGGRVRIGPTTVEVTGVWRPARVRQGRVRAGVPDAGAVPGFRVTGAARWMACHVADAVSAPTPAAMAGAVAALVGRGPGLTPSGDDALAGALLVARALERAPGLAAVVAEQLARTTAVSAALLSAAGEGYASEPVVRLVDAATAGDRAAAAQVLPRVLAIGHTSGADLVAGVGTALEVLAPERRVMAPERRWMGVA
jgi:hypothetical protein